MINLSFLELHQSFPLKLYGKLDALAQRKDLYTVDDFYFGFDSSNQSFLDIIGGKQPLAIKQGSTLSIYRQTVDGYSFEIFLIDANQQKLDHIISIMGKPTEGSVFRSILPFELTDFYMHAYSYSETKESEDQIASPEQTIRSILEILVKNGTLKESEISQLQKSCSAMNCCEFKLSDFGVFAQNNETPNCIK